MPFDYQGLAQLLGQQAQEMPYPTNPEEAGLSGILADAQQAFLDGSGRWNGGGGTMGGWGTGFGGGAPPPAAPGGGPTGGVNPLVPEIHRPSFGDNDPWGRGQFTDPHEAAFGEGQRPTQTDANQELGYLNPGWNNKLTRQIIGMGGAIPNYGLLLRGANQLVSGYNRNQSSRNQQGIQDFMGQHNLTTGDPRDDMETYIDIWNSAYDNASNAANTQNALGQAGYWGNRNDIGIPMNEDLMRQMGTATMSGQLDDREAFNAYLQASGGLRPMDGFFQAGWSAHDGPGGMSAGSLHRAVMDANWGRGGVMDFFNASEEPYFGQRI